MATNSHLQRGVRRRIASFLALALAIGGGALAGKATLPTESSAAAESHVGATSGRPYSYGWPVKPFDRQHPIRGYFGDPRTVFHGRATRETLMAGPGSFSFHRGIDISAPNGTPVYPVMSGVVKSKDDSEIVVDSGDGVAFEYWHLDFAVALGQRVEKERTVLGRIVAGAQHVHLSELRDARLVNPLAPGHLGPYEDRTVPAVRSVSFRDGGTGAALLPECVHGSVELVADAADAPAMPVPGMWHGLPVSPAVVTFEIRVLKTQKIVVPARNAVDVRHVLPASEYIWESYARGTHMNMAQFGRHRYWFQPGVYLFKLTPNRFDTTQLPDNVYALTTTAWDTAGNHSSATQIFTTVNATRREGCQ